VEEAADEDSDSALREKFLIKNAFEIRGLRERERERERERDL
jgi:hypothetical protein